MIESRDRLIREEDPFTPMSRQKSALGVSRFSTGGGGERSLFGSDSPSSITSVRGSSVGLVAIAASRNLAMRRASRLGYGRGRNLYVSSSFGSENVNPSGSGRRCRIRGKNDSILPSWYPRTPLRDITAVVNAIERRRNRLREAERHRLANQLPQEQNVQEPTLPITGAPLEHESSLTSPISTVSIKASPSNVVQFPKLLLKEQVINECDFLTPQKKLLNSIDEVEKVVMKEFQRIQKTPIAKKVEREMKVRKLMAMR